MCTFPTLQSGLAGGEIDGPWHKRFCVPNKRGILGGRDRVFYFSVRSFPLPVPLSVSYYPSSKGTVVLSSIRGQRISPLRHLDSWMVRLDFIVPIPTPHIGLHWTVSMRPRVAERTPVEIGHTIPANRILRLCYRTCLQDKERKISDIKGNC